MLGIPKEWWLRVARQMAGTRDLWQLDLLPGNEFARLARERGVRSFSEEDIRDLWRLGLLRADIVQVRETPATRGFEPVFTAGGDEGWFADLRDTSPRTDGWLDALQWSAPMPPGAVPWFHPYRLAVLLHLSHVFDARIHPLQYLRFSEGATAIEEFHRSRFEQLTRTPEFLVGLAKVTAAVDLAVLCEPYVSPDTVDWMRGWQDPEEHKRALAAYWSEVSPLLLELPEPEIEQARFQLCLLAETLDGNSTIRTIARFMNAQGRERLEGTLGGASLISASAEILRRGCEAVWGRELPEEDELLHGPYLREVKQRLYGSSRLLDHDGAVREEFLRQHGLDYGTRVRWYVEGETEYGALEWALGQFRPVELVRLHGAGGVGRADFREALQSDRRSRTFSFVAVDADRVDALRILERCIEAGELCGLVCVSNPDFEKENFDPEELAIALAELGRRQDVLLEEGPGLLLAAHTAESGDKLFREARQLSRSGLGIRKGRAWGAVLMELALGEPLWAGDCAKRTSDRAIVQSFWGAVGSIRTDYTRQLEKQAVTVFGGGSAADRLRQVGPA